MNPKAFLVLFALLASCALAPLTRAEPFFQASLWAPEPQLIEAHRDVKGLRLQIFGRNRNVTGLDLGFAHSTTGDFSGVSLFGFYNHVGGATTGIQWGLVNRTEGNVTGWQSGWVNINAARITGLQTGLVNWNRIESSDFSGLQVGLVNTAKNVTGLQIGLVNYAINLRGVQIGLWNEVYTRDWDHFDPLPKVFPFINIGF